MISGVYTHTHAHTHTHTLWWNESDYKKPGALVRTWLHFSKKEGIIFNTIVACVVLQNVVLQKVRKQDRKYKGWHEEQNRNSCKGWHEKPIDSARVDIRDLQIYLLNS